MPKYKYSVDADSIWASFGYGEVEAKNKIQARKLAIQKLEEDFQKVEDALSNSDNTKGFKIYFDDYYLELTKVNPPRDKKHN